MLVRITLKNPRMVIYSIDSDIRIRLYDKKTAGRDFNVFDYIANCKSDDFLKMQDGDTKSLGQVPLSEWYVKVCCKDETYQFMTTNRYTKEYYSFDIEYDRLMDSIGRKKHTYKTDLEKDRRIRSGVGGLSPC